MVAYEYQMIAAEERFLLFDSGVGDINRMFIFATNDGTDIFASSSQWFRYFFKYMQFMSWSIMKFFLAFLHFCRLKLK